MRGWMTRVFAVGLLAGCEGGAGGGDGLPAAGYTGSNGGAITGTCTVTLPASTTVVRGSVDTVEAGAVFWVCDGGSLNTEGANGVFVVESGGEVLSSGGAQVGYALDGSTVQVSGSGTTVYAEPAASVTVVGFNSATENCAAIAVDASAVAGGC